MTLPLPTLGYFIRVLVNAPSLHEVCIVAQEQHGVFPWELLLHLPRLPASVVLEVSYDPTTQPKVLDLALFLEHFRLASPGGFGATLKAGVKYIVQGFPSELLRLGEIDIPGLTFEPAPVADTKSRGHAET